MSGWIKLHRELIAWEWYTDHNTCRLFIHCILRANHTDTKWRGTQLNRGQFLTSLESLSNETGLTISQIRTGFKKLESTNEIASLSQARSRVVTVLNYDSYQSDDRLSDKLVASSSQADSKLIATDKNVITKEVNNNTSSEAIAPCPHDDIVKLYHSILPSLRRVKVWSDKRQKTLRTRWRENPKHQSLDFWEWYFNYVSKSQFLMGNANNFQADIEWLINPTNFIKVVEGKYDE